jgi:hypothetical protein
MGGGGGGKKKSSNNNNQPQYQPAPQDNSMQIWAAEMAAQRQDNARQYDEAQRQYSEQRRAEEAQRKADEAKREQALWDEKQKAKDAAALDQYKGAAESFANQAGGAPSDEKMEDSTTAAMNKRIGDKSKLSAPAPGLTPFGTSIVKPANMIYPTKVGRLGGL